MSLQVLIVPVTAFQQNCSVIWCTETMHGAVIDPGGDLEEILAGVQEHGVQLTKILLTHAHIDHAGATAELSRRLKLPIEGPHEGDRYWIEQLPAQARSFGFGKAEKFEPDRWLQQGDTVQVGNETLEISHCPGHTPGHVVFFSRSRQRLWEKGETSGHTLDLVELRHDCDADAILVLARPRGPVSRRSSPA